MTLPFADESTCAVCGTVREQMQLVSNTISGPPILTGGCPAGWSASSGGAEALWPSCGRQC